METTDRSNTKLVWYSDPHCIKLSYLDVVFDGCLHQVREVCLLRIDFVGVHEFRHRLQGGNFHILQIMKKIIGAESRNYTGN